MIKILFVPDQPSHTFGEEAGSCISKGFKQKQTDERLYLYASSHSLMHLPAHPNIMIHRQKKTSTEVLKSLPGDIWETYAETGWGPHGDKSFMSFDYRKPYQDETLAKDGSSGDSTKGEKTAPGMPPPHQAQDLFEGDSCAWTEYYRDEQTLNAVARLYAADFDMFGWYNLDEWRERLFRCLRGRQ